MGDFFLVGCVVQECSEEWAFFEMEEATAFEGARSWVACGGFVYFTMDFAVLALVSKGAFAAGSFSAFVLHG